MRRVVEKSQVAHLWAHQIQDEARTSGGNFYFYGDTIYSYGSHFPIARHVTNKKGERAVLFTTRGYSVTTSGHISVVRHAANHLNIIYIYNPKIDIKNKHAIASMFGQFLREMKEYLSHLATARKPEKYIEPARGILGRAEAFAQFVGVKVPKELTKLIENAADGKYTEYLVKEAARLERKRKEEDKIRQQKFQESLGKWRAGEGQTLYGRLELRDYLRIGDKGRIETSQGVVIPQEAARRFYNWVKKTIESGGCAGNCEHKILDYSVDEVTDEYIKVGCHVIYHTESNAIAEKLGW